MSRLRLFWVALVFLLASLSHFELHVYTIQTPAAKRLVAEKYKWQSSNLHPRFLRFKMCWCITTFKSYFSFPLVFTAAAHSEWEIFWPYKTLQDLVRPCTTLKDLGTKSAFLAEQRFINSTWQVSPWVQRKLFKRESFASPKVPPFPPPPCHVSLQKIPASDRVRCCAGLSVLILVLAMVRWGDEN